MKIYQLILGNRNKVNKSKFIFIDDDQSETGCIKAYRYCAISKKCEYHYGIRIL